jgi:hypothetical protein
MCGESAEEALEYLLFLEKETDPERRIDPER